MRTPGLAAFLAALGDVPHSTDAALCAQKSRDFHWFSPILREALRGRVAEAVVAPRTEGEVMRVARAAARARVPLTCRGAGTGNFGQAVPLKGGAVLDLSDLTGIRRLDPFRLRAAAGETLLGIDRAAQADVRAELRIHPSTRRTATLGGFIAGGHAGVGSVSCGILRDPGNILAVRIVTAEEEPRVLEITGTAVETVHHAYGVNGIITEVELPLARAEPWVECIVAFATFAGAARFGLALALADGIVKKLVSPIAAPLTRFFGPLRPACPEGAAVVLAMVSEVSLHAMRGLAAEMGGQVTLEAAEGEGPDRVPLYEYAWGHTHFQAIKADRRYTYLICIFPAEGTLEAIERVESELRHELWMHLECVRFGGRPTAQGVPVLLYEGKQQLARLTAALERLGCRVANGHTWFLQNGGMKRIDASQLAFRRETDPMGLLNPGKIAGLDEGVEVSGGAADLPASGWVFECEDARRPLSPHGDARIAF